MIALALLASHLVGDFILQTRWQANGKLDDHWIRTRHVWAYMLPFVVWVPFLDVPLWRMLVFGGALAGLHFLTDSRRFYSTLGDVVGWRTMHLWRNPRQMKPEYLRELQRQMWQEHMGPGDGWHESQPVPDDWLDWPPPNPWPALPLMIDQTLHVVQLAALGWLLV